MGKAFIPTPTRPHQAEPSHNCQLGLIWQSLHSPGGASIPDLTGRRLYLRSYRTELPHQRQPGLIGQNLYTRPHQAEPLYQVLSGRASAPTSTRPHWAEPPPLRQSSLIGQGLYTNTSQALSSCTFMYIRFKRKSKLRFRSSYFMLLCIILS